jgi:hypothetical protein
MWNAGSEPARMIEVISPAGFECFFEELSDLLSAGQPAPTAVPDIAKRYGVQFSNPPWVPDVINRYRLSPPPGLPPARN